MRSMNEWLAMILVERYVGRGQCTQSVFSEFVEASEEMLKADGVVVIPVHLAGVLIPEGL